MRPGSGSYLLVRKLSQHASIRFVYKFEDGDVFSDHSIRLKPRHLVILPLAGGEKRWIQAFPKVTSAKVNAIEDPEI